MSEGIVKAQDARGDARLAIVFFDFFFDSSTISVAIFLFSPNKLSYLQNHLYPR